MKASIRFLIVLLALSSLTIVASAQDASIIQTVTVKYERWSRFVMSPDDHYLVVFQESVFLGDPIIDNDLLSIKLVDLTTDPPITHTLTAHTDYVINAVFSSDGSRLVTLHTNGAINVWDIASRDIIQTVHTRRYGQGRVDIALTPDDQTLIMVANSGIFALADTWDLNTGYRTHQYGRTFETFFEFQEFMDTFRTGELFSTVAVSPNGNFILTATGRNGLWLWSADGSSDTEIKANTEDLPRFDMRRLIYLNENRALYHHRGNETLYIVQVPSGLELPLIQEIKYPLFDTMHDSTTIAWLEADGVTISFAPVESVQEKSSVTLNLPDSVGFDDRAQGNLFLFDAGTNKVAVGGFTNEDLENNIIYILTINE